MLTMRIFCLTNIPSCPGVTLPSPPFPPRGERGGVNTYNNNKLLNITEISIPDKSITTT